MCVALQNWLKSVGVNISTRFHKTENEKLRIISCKKKKIGVRNSKRSYMRTTTKLNTTRLKELPQISFYMQEHQILIP